MDLDWRRFLVAEAKGRIIATGQIKPHSDGSRELASIAVVPDHQGRGVGSAIVYALLARSSGVLYLTCTQWNVGYYERFGFRRIGRAEMTPYFKCLSCLVSVILTVLRRPERLNVMRRGF